MHGQRLGSRYLLGSWLGGGAMGQVFLARTTDDADRRLAVKLLRPELAEDPDLVSRFLQESRLLRRVRHPNVVRVLDLVAEEDRFGIVMEYVPDGDLRRAVSLPCPTDLVLELLAQVADGLAAIHTAGIVHRDLKPENVLVQRLEGGSIRARVTDFGVSHHSDSVSTRHNGMLGTTGYLSPESARGLRAGPEGDVYALGVMLYEMCAGHRPFVAENPLAVVRAHASEEAPRPPEVPEPLWRLLALLLAKDPALRPTAAAARDRLRALAGTAVGATLLSGDHRPPAAPGAPVLADQAGITPRPTAAEAPSPGTLTSSAPPAQTFASAENDLETPENEPGTQENGPGAQGRSGGTPADTRSAGGDVPLRRAVRDARTARRAGRDRKAIVIAAIGVPLVLLALPAMVKLLKPSLTPAVTSTPGPTVHGVATIPATPVPASVSASASTTTPAGTSTSAPTTRAPVFPVPGIPTLAVSQPTADSVEDSDRKASLVLNSVTPTAGTLSSIMILYRGGSLQIAPVNGFAGPYYATVKGLQNGSAYTFAARVCNSYGECSDSRPVTFTPYTLPTLDRLTANTTAGTATVNWPALALNGNPRPWSCRLTADTVPHDSRAPNHESVAIHGGHTSWTPRPRSIYTAWETCTDGARTIVGPPLTFDTN